MRAGVVDHRLEAVAGEPLHVATEPTRVSNYPGGTILAVGRYVYAPENISSQQMLIHGVGGRGYAYVRNDPAVWLAGPEVPVNQRGNNGDIWWAWNLNANPGQMGLGLHANQNHYDWRSSMIGVAYGRTLTDPEAMRVIRWMIPRLG